MKFWSTMETSSLVITMNTVAVRLAKGEITSRYILSKICFGMGFHKSQGSYLALLTVN